MVGIGRTVSIIGNNSAINALTFDDQVFDSGCWESLNLQL